MPALDLGSGADAAIAMVATSSPRLPDAARILAACDATAASPARKRGLFGALFGRMSSTAAAKLWKDGNLVTELRGGHLAVSLMPAPIPWRDLEGPCATAWWWPQATEQMRSHRYHFLVALIRGDIERVERRVLLTHVVRAVVSTTDAIGVYWGEGTLVHEPRMFLEQSARIAPDHIPGMLWIDVRVEPNADKSFRCFTTGLAPLGFLEIEVARSLLKPQDLIELIGDTACYIVNGRKRIKDGETMGRTETERYKVRHVPSMFGRGKVMRLLMQ